MLRIRSIKLVLLCCLLLILSACNRSTIAHDLSQARANEIVAVLNQHGISAVSRKGTGTRASFRVEVEQTNYAEATTILYRRNLLEEPRQSFSDIIAQRGLVPNSREVELLRLDHALAVELEETLKARPGVFDARVVVRMNFLKDGEQPRVSAVIHAMPGSDVPQEEVVPLIVNAVPGIELDHIAVSLHESEEEGGELSSEGAYNEGGTIVRVPLVPFLMGWRVPEGDVNSLVVAVMLLLLLMGCVCLVVGYWFGLVKQSKKLYEAQQLAGYDPARLRIDQASADVQDLTEI